MSQSTHTCASCHLSVTKRKMSIICVNKCILLSLNSLFIKTLNIVLLKNHGELVQTMKC